MLLVMMCCGMAVTNAQTSYNLSITTEGVGAISYTTPTSSGVVDANMSNSFTIYEGEELQLTFTPGSDAYKLVTATMNSTNIMADMTGNTYTVSSVSGNVTIYGAFDIAIKHGTMQTTVIDGIEWTYTVTDETNKRCQLGAIDSLVNSITAVPTSTVAENLAIPSVINGYTVYGLSVQAFYGCSGLTGQLNIPSTVTFIGDQAFQGTHFSGPLTLPEGLNDLCSYSFYNLYNLTGDLVIPESLTVLPAYAFFNCQGFTSLTLPAGVTNLWTRCFGQMSGLKQITCYATTPPTIGAENVFSDYTIPLFVPAESVDAYKAATYWSNFTNIYAIGTVLDHTLTVASSGGGKIVGAIKNLTGEIYSEFESNPDSDDPVEFPVTVPVGYSVEMTFTPNTGYYLYRVMKNDMEEISGQMVDNKLTLTDVNEDMKLSAEFLRTQLLLQVNSQTTYGTTNWEVTDVLGGGTVTSGTVQNEVQDVPVFYGSTVKVTFTYDQTQYSLSQLLRGTTDILGSLAADGSYTITNYTKTDTITVSFAELPTEAYAALDGNTLTFYYDKQKAARGGMSVDFGGNINLCEWYAHKDDITTVVFDSSMDNCTSLTSTASWFYDMTNLTTIQGLSNLHTDNVTDMHQMFFCCSSLASIDMASLNTSSVTNMNKMFESCSSLTTLDLSSNNTANVTYMQLMFQNCTALTSINLGGQFSTASVTTMQAMFNGCSSLQSLDLTNFNTANVTNMFQMFIGCRQLASVMVGDGWTTAGASSDQLFLDNDALVGGRGTAYADFGANDTAYRMATYARVDGGPQSETPGYFMDANTPTSYNIKVTVVGQGNAVATYSSNQTIIYSNSDNDFSVVRGESMTLAITPDTGYRLSTVVVDTTDVTSQVIADSTGVSYYTLTGIYDAHNVTVTFINDIDEAYAVYSEDYTVLTFYYDKNRESRNGMSVENTGILGDPGWHNSAASTNVKTVVFDPSFDAFRPTTTRYWFAEMSLLTTIEGMQYLHVDNVTTMDDMFSGCSGLVNLDLSGFNTANVTGMSSMFSGCSALQTIYVGSNWSTASVASGAYMFTGCTALVGSKGTTYDANHTDYTYAHIDGGPSNPGYFSDPNAPTSYTVKVTVVGNGSVTDGATTISSDSEQTLTVPAGQATVLTITAAPGYKLESVKNDTVNVMSQLTETEAGFTYNLGNVYDNYEITATFVNDTPEAYAVLSNDTEMGINTLLTFYYDTKKLERFGIDIIPFSSPADRGHWDNWCQTIQKVVIDTSFANYTNLTSTAYWFSGCLALKTIEGIENLKTQNVTDMHGMFESCSNLTNLVVTGFNTSNVTNMSNMFAQCSQLTSLDISNFDTSQATDLSRMFTSCASISSLDVSNFNTSNVMDMSGMFASCESLTSLNLSNFNTSKVTKMNSMFMSNIGLTTLDLTNFNTANVTDMGYMFASSNNLTTIYTGENWTTAAVTESTSMFSDCTALVGGKGTVYDANHIDAAYAHIDGGAANPGYLTDINAPTTYTVTVDVFGGGSVTAGGETITEYTDYNREVSVDAGGSLLLTFTPAADHRLATVLLDGTDVMSQVITDSTGVSYYTLTSIYDDHTVTATFVDATIDVVGNTDFSSAWWTAFSSNYEIPADHTLHMQFTNHSDKVNNWDNWVLMCTADSTRTPEYFALRADNYGWGDYYNGDGLSSNWTDWDAFREGMDGALVDLTVRRWGSEVTVTTVAKAADDTEYVQTLITTIDPAADQSINVFLTVENAYLEIYKNSITLTPSEAPAIPEAYAVLSADSLTVTFYYDTKKQARGGMDINSSYVDASPYGSATTAVIDASFADYYPTSTAYWFMACSNLTSIDGMANLKTANVTDMYAMFSGCSGLTSLDVSSFNTANVTNMTWMFEGCSALASLDVSGFNTANVTYMGGMFIGCSGLTSLDVSGFNTANVTHIGAMFHGCSGLMSLDVSGFNTANVTNMSDMFDDCSSLTSLDVSHFNTANVTDMGAMFYSCSGLTAIYVGEGWSTENVTNSTNMFEGCTALVGGLGTVYDADHVDAAYAHIDGGTANPGYFSPLLQKGDANGDGDVNIADAVATVTNILGEPATGNFYRSMADMNGDDEIDIFDVTMIVNAALAANNTGGSRDMAVPSNISRIAAEDIRLTAAANRVSVGVERVEQFTAFQFDVTLPEGTELVGVKLSTGVTDHQLSFQKRGDGQYRVVGLSMSNEVCYSPDGNQLQLQLSGATGSDGVRVSNMLFVNPVAKDATGIRQPTAGAVQDGGYYDLNGRYMGTDRRQLSKGMYIKNHKKVIIK